MNLCVKVINDQLVCLKNNHNENVIFVVVDEQVPCQERFLCQKCLKAKKSTSKRITIDLAIEEFKQTSLEKNRRQNEVREETIRTLKQFSLKFSNVQTKITRLLDEIQRISKLWINDLYSLKKKNFQLSVIEKFLFEYSKEDDQEKDGKTMNQAYFQKIEFLQKQLLDSKDQEDCLNTLKNSIPQEKLTKKKKLNTQEQTQIQGENSTLINVAVVQNIPQIEWSGAMAFNKLGTIMVAGCNEFLKIWNFESGQLKLLKKLSGHSDKVLCLVFSKQMNWFVSGSKDKWIRLWKEINSNIWRSTQSEQQHTKAIICLILNSYENQLISCGQDVKVWKVDCEKNQLEYDYNLENRHTEEVYGISFNEAETSLVTCSYDKKIILWMKDKKDQWKYQHHLMNDDFGYRICFLDNTQIAWLQKSKGILHIFKIENGNLIKKPEFNIELNKYYDCECLFPTILNKKKQILILKHHQYVYILQKQEDGKLYSAYCEPIYCNDLWSYGALTNDGDFLIIWDNGTKEFRVYKLEYV